MGQINSEGHYEIICLEITRHLEDAETSKLAHFDAASSFEKWNKFILGLPATLAATVLACIVNRDSKGTSTMEAWLNMLKIVLSIIVPALSASITFLNLNDIATNHRTAAQRYSELSRKCKNWKTDFPDDTNNEKAKEMVQKYREEIISINKESPQIPKWAWKSVSKQKREGSTTYDNEDQTVNLIH